MGKFPKQLYMTLGLATGLLGCDVGSSGNINNGGPDGGNGQQPDGAISSTPRLDISLDKTALPTELLATSSLTITSKSSGGFAGAVNLTATVVDGGGLAIPGYTAVIDTPTLTMPANGTLTAKVTVTTSNKPAAAASVKITATSAAAAGTNTASSTMTVANQVTITIMDGGGGNCVYPPAPLSVRLGTKLRFKAGSAFPVDNNGQPGMTIHSEGDANGVPHAGAGLALDQAYEKTLTGGVGSFVWYCHQRNQVNQTLNVVAQ
jgi:plastocyanin